MVEQAVEHNIRKRTFRRSSMFDGFDNGECKFTEDIQALLDRFIFNAAEIFPKMDVQERFHSSLYTA